MSDFIINRIFLKNVQNFIFITPTTLSCSSCGNRYFCIFPVLIIVWSMWITSHHLIQFFCLILLCKPTKVVDDFQFLFASVIMYCNALGLRVYDYSLYQGNKLFLFNSIHCANLPAIVMGPAEECAVGPFGQVSTNIT